MVSYNTQFLIGGDLIEPESDEKFATEDPAQGEVLANVPVGNQNDVEQAVTTARRAFNDQWQNADPEKRSTVLKRIAQIYRTHAEELADVEVKNNGSPRAPMSSDVERAASRLEYFAGLTRELEGETHEVSGNTLNFTVREPKGVVAGIIPFNHPLMFVASKIGPALAAGNTVVIKPSEYTPLSALTVAKYLAADDEIPDGVINIIAGEGETGSLLANHPDVDMISFVGSAQTGSKIVESAADRIASVHLELGGKNPAIVFPDATLDTAIQGCVGAMNLAWQGQSCASGSRTLVHESIHDDIVAGLADLFESIRVGPPNEENTDMGAIVSEPQFEKVKKYIQLGKESSAKLITGGDVIDIEGSNGYYVEPTIFTEVDPDSRIAQEEIFGPILSVISWSEYDEMLEIANGIDYGLTASVWTENLRTALETVKRLDAGYIWVNEHGPHYLGSPRGGVKQSGIGHSNSRQTALEHTRTKTITVNLSSSDWDWEV